MKKNKQFTVPGADMMSAEPLEILEEEVLYTEETPEVVVEPVPEPVVVANMVVEKPVAKSKAANKGPIIPITEVARQYKQYKKYHDASLLTFCRVTGLPTEGTAAEMKAVLLKFGW